MPLTKMCSILLLKKYKFLLQDSYEQSQKRSHLFGGTYYMYILGDVYLGVIVSKDRNLTVLRFILMIHLK